MVQFHKKSQSRRIDRPDLHQVENHNRFMTRFRSSSQDVDRATRHDTASAAQRNFISISMHKDSQHTLVLDGIRAQSMNNSALVRNS
jgi:hypothetical protein